MRRTRQGDRTRDRIDPPSEARNAWGADFNEGLARHFAAMEDDDGVRCAILTGDEDGGAFSAGANLKDPRRA
jgi:enoyl-CoA hydratase/carnithine racemase